MRWCGSEVEHFLGKEGVTGSIPVISFFYCLKIKDFLNLSNSKLLQKLLKIQDIDSDYFL